MPSSVPFPFADSEDEEKVGGGLGRVQRLHKRPCGMRIGALCVDPRCLDRLPGVPPPPPPGGRSVDRKQKHVV